MALAEIYLTTLFAFVSGSLSTLIFMRFYKKMKERKIEKYR